MQQKFLFPYMPDRFAATRRETIPVRVGRAVIGGNNPILIQSMTTTKPKDVDKTVRQMIALAEAGCELVRITAPTLADACALKEVMQKVRAQGCDVPVSADIHFQPAAAFEALKWVEKVRINPGNFVEAGIATLDKQNEKSFDEGRAKVFEAFSPFVREAKRLGRAIRIGVNHGSLSARMLYRYGDTAEGMVESAIEYLSVCEYENFDQVVVSLKSSNPRVAIEAYRMLAARLNQERFKPYPFHVGVTEAGAGEDGRLKSAVGIGALLLDGLGDTIRVSLTEDAVAEIPVARDLIEACSIVNSPKIDVPELEKDPFHFVRRETAPITFAGTEIGGSNPIRVGERTLVVVPSTKPRSPEFAVGKLSESPIVQLNSMLDVAAFASDPTKYSSPSLFCYTGDHAVPAVRMLTAILEKYKRQDPILLYASIGNEPIEKLKLAATWGSLLVDGIGDAVCIEIPSSTKEAVSLAYDILQAASMRRSKTEFISCPGCGRTLYNIQDVLSKIKARFGHLDNVSIAVMGCIVNGPGEMAGADFGYVGGGPGRITLYEGKEPVKKNIPESDAIDELVELLKNRGLWKDPN